MTGGAKRILVVDPDRKSRRILEVMLRKAGHEVVGVETGRDALSAIELNPVELIIAETALPDGTGFDLCGHVRGLPDGEELPFIFLTQSRDMADKLRGFELGVEDYIAKPVYVKEVVARAGILLQRRDKERLAEDQAYTVSGTLEDMSLVDIFQTIEDGRKTGSLRIEAHRRLAAVHFANGAPLEARVGVLSGEAAVHRLLRWSEGRFVLKYVPLLRRPRRIEGTFSELLADGLQRLEQFESLAASFAPLEMVFRVDYRRLADHVRDLPEAVLDVLHLFDARRTLRDVVDDSPLPDVETVEVVRRLADEGLLERLGLAADVTGEVEAVAMELEPSRLGGSGAWARRETAEERAAREAEERRRQEEEERLRSELESLRGLRSEAARRVESAAEQVKALLAEQSAIEARERDLAERLATRREGSSTADFPAMKFDEEESPTSPVRTRRSTTGSHLVVEGVDEVLAWLDRQPDAPAAADEAARPKRDTFDYPALVFPGESPEPSKMGAPPGEPLPPALPAPARTPTPAAMPSAAGAHGHQRISTDPRFRVDMVGETARVELEALKRSVDAERRQLEQMQREAESERARSLQIQRELKEEQRQAEELGALQAEQERLEVERRQLVAQRARLQAQLRAEREQLEEARRRLQEAAEARASRPLPAVPSEAELSEVEPLPLASAPRPTAVPAATEPPAAAARETATTAAPPPPRPAVPPARPDAVDGSGESAVLAVEEARRRLLGAVRTSADQPAASAFGPPRAAASLTPSASTAAVDRTSVSETPTRGATALAAAPALPDRPPAITDRPPAVPDRPLAITDRPPAVPDRPPAAVRAAFEEARADLERATPRPTPPTPAGGEALRHAAVPPPIPGDVFDEAPSEQETPRGGVPLVTAAVQPGPPGPAEPPAAGLGDDEFEGFFQRADEEDFYAALGTAAPRRHRARVALLWGVPLVLAAVAATLLFALDEGPARRPAAPPEPPRPTAEQLAQMQSDASNRAQALAPGTVDTARSVGALQFALGVARELAAHVALLSRGGQPSAPTQATSPAPEEAAATEAVPSEAESPAAPPGVGTGSALPAETAVSAVTTSPAEVAVSAVAATEPAPTAHATAEPQGHAAPPTQTPTGASHHTSQGATPGADQADHHHGHHGQADQATAETEAPPFDPQQGMQRARELMSSGTYGEAAAELRLVVDAQPGNRRAHQYLGECLLNLDEAREAVPHLQRATDVARPDDDALLLLGSAQTDAGDTSAAATTYRRYLELYPDGDHAAEVRAILEH